MLPVFLLILSGVVCACGGATPRPEPATPLPGAEGGGDAFAVAPPPVDMLSLVPGGDDLALFLRADLVRGSAVAPTLLGILRDEGALEELTALGVDPVQDVDRVLIAGRESANDPDVVAFEHRWSEAQLTEIYGRTFGSPEGGAPVTTDAGRFRVVTLPNARTHLVVLSPTLAALAPPAMVSVVIARAEAPGTDAGETGRRLRALDEAAPDLAPTAALRVSASNVQGDADWSGELTRLGLPAPAWGVVVVALDDGATVFARAGWGDDSSAQLAERGVRGMLTQSLHPMTLLLRLMGLARAVEASQVVLDGDEVTLRTHLTHDEVQRVLERLRSSP